jgi:membrane fusion protein (multidrug efflux system)
MRTDRGHELSEDHMVHGAAVRAFLTFLTVCLVSLGAAAQLAPSGPPAVGIVRAERQQITQTDEFIGRVQAVGQVSLVARVTAFLEKRLFTEGSEVKQGDLLYVLEQPPFQAQVDASKATVEQLEAQHRDAALTLERAQALMRGPAGQQSNVDAAFAKERALAAQIDGAKAQLRQAQINLGYTEIRAPIDGRVSSTTVTEGNVVSPSSGTLATLVSQDPMYVLFSVASRTARDLRNRYVPKGGFAAVVIRLRMPDGTMYAHEGKLDYVSPTVAENTDTLTLRAVMPNPLVPGLQAGAAGARDLVDGLFVSVQLEGVQPVTVLGIPRSAVLSDQQGDYVYVVDAQSKAQVRRIQLGQSTPSTAVVTSGLEAGEMVISEGLQRVRPGQPVSAGPATPPPAVPSRDAASPTTSPAGAAPPGSAAASPSAGSSDKKQ